MKVTLFEKKYKTEITDIEWCSLMERIKTGYWNNIVEKCRGERFSQDVVNRKLPAFGISVTFVGGDAAANMVTYTHIVGIDFNKPFLDKAIADKSIAECRKICTEIPSVIGFYTTKSGRGFRLFVKVNSGIKDHHHIYHPLQQYFENLLGLKSDPKYRFITRLSFVSSDPHCFYRPVEEAEAFDVKNLIPDITTENQEEMNDMELKVLNYLSNKYDFRYNLFEKSIQFRINNPLFAIKEACQWHSLDDKYEDAMVKDIYENCTHITYNQFEWIKKNQVIVPYYDPVDEYINSLPEWDGRDRLTEYASLVTDDTESLKQWLVTMFLKWLSPNDVQNRILVMSTSTRGTCLSWWIHDLLPAPLKKYMMETYNSFVYGLSFPRLLISFKNFNFDPMHIRIARYIRAINGRASFILTDSKDVIGDLSGATFLKIKIKNSDSEIVVDDEYLNQLYSQIMTTNS